MISNLFVGAEVAKKIWVSYLLLGKKVLKLNWNFFKITNRIIVFRTIPHILNQVPDTFFANEKQAYFHTATTPNRYGSIETLNE